jgi:hypothetical protein
MADPMTAKQFFEHPSVHFPMDRDDEDFQAFIAKRFKGYVDLINGMQPDDSITTQIKQEVKRITELCDLLKKAIGEYLGGWPHKAYDSLDKAIQGVQAELNHCVKKVDHAFQYQLYRIRKESEPEPGIVFRKPDLFHIPFDKRHRVARQRYSIQGLPCLYLGGTLYVCWEELRRPKFESIHVARFAVAPGQELHLLDFMQRPKHIAQGIQDKYDKGTEPDVHEFSSLAVCWPLMAAAAVKHKGDPPFIVEYIIPQLILQWITTHEYEPDLDGIAYSSVRCPHVAYPPGIGNFVFPAREMAAFGYCSRLRQKFAITEAVAWHILESEGIILPNNGLAAYHMAVELIPGQGATYGNTRFGRQDARLLNLPTSVL